MKKIITILIIFCLLFSGSACEANANSEPNNNPQKEAAAISYYIGNKETKKYHLPTCNYLPHPSNQIRLYSKLEINRKGYTPCLHCFD